MNYFKVVGMFWLTAVPMLLRIVNAPAGRAAEYAQNSVYPNQLPDVFSLTEMYNRGAIDSNTFSTTGQKLGYGIEWLIPLFLANQQYLTGYEYINAWRRGIISESMMETCLENIKLQKFEREVLLQISEYFPSPSDLVSFAVREVYSPEIVEKFGQKQDLPAIFVSEAQKLGMSKEQASNYWAAHWDLPSISQGFEMLHRRVIDEKELEMLLKALDVMPFWRDRLTKISYQPLTRVDVRRMYSVGVLDREGVYNAYLDVGYNQKDADLMTEFTIRYENDAMEGLTRATVVDAYKDSIISRDQLKDYLIGFSYTDEVVEFWLNSADYDRTLAEIKMYKDDLIELYKMGSITLDEAKNYLLTQDLPATYIDQVIHEAVTLKATRTKVPSKDDLDQWLRKGIIEETYYVQKLRLLGFKDEDILIYLQLIAEGLETNKRKYLPIETYRRWLSTGIMSETDFYNTLFAMGINEDEIQLMILELKETTNANQ